MAVGKQTLEALIEHIPKSIPVKVHEQEHRFKKCSWQVVHKVCGFDTYQYRQEGLVFKNQPFLRIRKVNKLLSY